MYAIFEAGGAQHKVTEGEFVKLNNPNFAVGEEVTFDKVKVYSDGEDFLVGQPDLPQVRVTGLVRTIIKGPKIRIHKSRPRKHYETRIGHRQKYSIVRISKISKAEEVQQPS